MIQKERPLELAEPVLHRSLKKEMDALHLHPYDMKASVCEGESSSEVILRFGDGFQQSATQRLVHDENVLTDFFKTAAEACRQAVINDYYKRINPS